jgi:hypothetical protein
MVTRTRNRTVRIQEIASNKQRYWDPKDGLYTGLLQGHSSMERYYSRKGLVVRPPGKLAYYVNKDKRDFTSVNLIEQAEMRARAMTGPFPTGGKATRCSCSVNCVAWEEHYEKRDLFFDHWEEDHKVAEGTLSQDQMEQMMGFLISQGWEPPGEVNDNAAPADSDSEAFAAEGDSLLPDEEEAQAKPSKNHR